MSPRLAGPALILLMALGSAALWIGMPIAWLWIASLLQEGTSPSLGAYALLIVGLPASMAAIGKGLAVLDRVYARVTGTAGGERRQLPWMRSLRGDRVVESRRTVLDVVMIVSVIIALAAMAIWFAFFAGSPLPRS